MKRLAFFHLTLLAVIAATLLGGSSAQAAGPALRLPWPPGVAHEHNIYGGNTYGCGTHSNPTRNYFGIDFVFAIGDQVTAVADGTIVAGQSDRTNDDDRGNFLEIDHGNGYHSRYLHLRADTPWASGIQIPSADTQGSVVTQGQLIGYSGDTPVGQVPAHLHFDMQFYDTHGSSHALRAEPMSGIWGFGFWGLSLESGLNPVSYGCIDPVADAQQWAALGCTYSTCGYVHDPSPYWDSSCPGDSDCDGFPDSVPRAPPNAHASEVFMGTDPLVACAATPTRYDEPPPNKWPVDFDDNQTANGNDLLTFAPVFGSISPNPPYNARFDLNNDGRINGSDFLVFAPFLGKRCAP